MTQQPDVTLIRVELSPGSSSLALGLTTELQLFAVYSNGIRVDVTGQATFTSSTAALTLSGARATAASQGTSLVTGSFQGQTAQSQIQVTTATLSSLRIDPPSATLAAGLSQSFRAYGTFSDGSIDEVTSSVSWSVLEPARAEFLANPKGSLRALSAGNTQVQAVLQGRTARADLSVTSAVLESLEVSPRPVSLPAGIGQQFVATGVYSDGSHRTVTQDVTWSSSDTDTFLISDAVGSKGIGAGVKTGSVTVTARLGAVSGLGEVTVNEAVLQSLTLTPTNGSLPRGLELDFRAEGRFSDGRTRDMSDQVVWDSSASAVAEVSNLPGSTGRVRALQLGDTTISASLLGVSQSTTLTVTAAALQRLEVEGIAPELPAGLTRQLTARGYFSDGTQDDLSHQVVWSSSNPEVAVVDQRGLVTSKESGGTTISVERGAISGNGELTVSAAVLQSLTLAPLDGQLPLGLTCRFTATGHYSDSSESNLSDQVTWSSSDDLTASISNASGTEGLARALKTGTVEIRARLGTQESKTGLEVTAAVVTKVLVSPTTLSLPVGLGAPLRATAVYSDGRQSVVTDPVEWTSADASVTVDSSGRVLGAAEGGSLVTARLGEVVGEVNVRVSGSVASLKVLTGAAASSRGAKTRFYALATLSDGSSRDATEDVQWSVQPSTFGTITQGANRPGEMTAATSGPTSAQVLATLGSLQSQRSIGNSSRTGFAAFPRSLNLPVGARRSVRAFTNLRNELPRAIWQSEDPSIATVTNGEVVANGPGNTTISLSDGSSTWPGLIVHVPASPLVAIEVQAPSGSIPAGTWGAVSAQAVTAAGERFEISHLAEWTSSDPETLLVNAGRVEARGGGSAQVTARFAGFSASASVSTGGDSPAAVFVDSNASHGGDGSQAHPFNNLSEAMDRLSSGGKLFAFAGTADADGMQFSGSLPAGFEFRGQGAGWQGCGIAAGEFPFVQTTDLRINNDTLLQGLAGRDENVGSFETAANATMDNVRWNTNTLRFGTVQGACRLTNSEILNRGNTTGGQAFIVESLTANFPLSGSIEIGNITLRQSNVNGNGFIQALVSGVGIDGLAPGFRLNIHDNVQQLERPGTFIGNFGTIAVEAELGEITVTNNTGGDRAQIGLSSAFPPSRVVVSDNTWGSCDLQVVDGGIDVEYSRNQLTGELALRDFNFLLPTPPVGMEVRIEDNRCATMQLMSLSRLLLVQRNRADSISLNSMTPPVTAPYERRVGIRDNQLGTGGLGTRLEGPARKALAVSGNQGGSLNLLGSSDLVVEGLSILSTLNTFSAYLFGNTFVDAPVDSQGIPY
jgi:hypothetical protein